MGLDQAVTHLVAGVGFRHATQPDEIAALVRAALEAAGADPGDLRALATASDRAGEPAVVRAARLLGVALVAIAPADLIAVDDRVPTRSARIAASRGVGSVAEAAALAAAGAGGRLVVARMVGAGATCALASVPVSGQSPSP
ncbi:precorrin methylase [Methylobacterium sp. Leaf399]|nr:cobalamin biosynthesis protein [Methylobacterium sp. Leaf399]KQT19355.1 precorrin methylase [Methylobacterium sp. Leaf399]